MDREKLEKNIASNLTIDLDVEKYIEITLLDIEQYANQRVIEELESQQSEPFINFAKEVIEYYEQHDIGDEDIYNKAKKLINGG
jgi:hypothetical protein